MTPKHLETPDEWEIEYAELSGHGKFGAKLVHKDGTELTCRAIKTYEVPGFTNAHRVVIGGRTVAEGMDIEHSWEARNALETAMQEYESED